MTDRDRSILAAYQQGTTMLAIATQVGLSEMRVCQILHRGGLTRRDGGAALRARQREEAALRARRLKTKTPPAYS